MIEEKIVYTQITIYDVNGVEFDTREKAEEYEDILLLRENFKGWSWEKKPIDLTAFQSKEEIMHCIDANVYFFIIKNKKVKHLIWSESSTDASLNKDSDEEEKWFWNTDDEEWQPVEEVIREYEEKIASLKEVFGE